MGGRDRKQSLADRTPALEWIASGLGLLLTLGVLGSIGWEAVKGGNGRPPAIAVTVESVTPIASGYVVEIRARNRSAATAAAVQIEGKLDKGGAPVTSTASIDYVPGESDRRAGLFFADDPRAYPLEVRAVGYAKP
jgi:uncharacterized protein (TIGR02588 family)